MRRIADLTGKKFGYLLVLGMADRKVDDNGKLSEVTWICRCEACGEEIDVPAKQLRDSSNRTSCGCVKKEKQPPKPRKIKLPEALKTTCENKATGRKWICKFPSPDCLLSGRGWCCFDCEVKNCEDRCLNTPVTCGAKEIKKG